MSPRTVPSARHYGAVQPTADSRLLPQQSARSDLAPADGGAFEVEDGTETGSTSYLRDSRTKRWTSIAAVCCLAAGALTATVRAGYSTTSAPAPQESTANLLQRQEDIGSNAAATATTTTTARSVPAATTTMRSAAAATTTTTTVRSPQAEVVQSLPLEEAPLSFTALNFYHIRDGKPALDYPWLKDVKLIEPHRETTLAVVNARDGYDYKWEIRSGAADMGGELLASASGSETVATVTTFDEHAIVLEEVSPAGDVTRRVEETVMVKYVRREIRTLTDDEREELLDAMLVLWKVKAEGDGNGKELYGENYADIYAINRLHYKAASPLKCDHFHDGLGFLTNHALLTNTFEASLQLVNPKLALPYWDFTIETSTAGSDGAYVFQPQTKTPIFQDSWFGTADTVDSMVKDGRWAFTEIPLMETNNPGGVDPDVYGKLRAPWVVNDRSYLSRGMGKMCGGDVSDIYPWPTCSSHFDLATSYTDFYSWVWESLYDPHGPVHIWIGGVLDCDPTYDLIGDLVGEEISSSLSLYSFLHRKNLYRDNFFSCEGTVGIDVPPSEVLASGTCGCLDYDLSQGDDWRTIYDNMAFVDDYIGDYDDDIKRQVVAALCTGTVNDGDHLQASSSLDPSFWSTHPTMERLWMYSVLTGQVTDMSWADQNLDYVDTDGESVHKMLNIYTEDCSGHRGSDIFPYELLDTDVDGFDVSTGIRQNAGMGNKLTNREVLQAFDPRANEMSYVYDTFKWTHCEDDGVDFDDAWKASTTAKRAGAKATNGKPHGGFKKGDHGMPTYSGLKSRAAEFRAKRESLAKHD